MLFWTLKNPTLPVTLYPWLFAFAASGALVLFLPHCSQTEPRSPISKLSQQILTPSATHSVTRGGSREQQRYRNSRTVLVFKGMTRKLRTTFFEIWGVELDRLDGLMSSPKRREFSPAPLIKGTAGVQNISQTGWSKFSAVSLTALIGGSHFISLCLKLLTCQQGRRIPSL